MAVRSLLTEARGRGSSSGPVEVTAAVAEVTPTAAVLTGQPSTAASGAEEAGMVTS